jgi:hypothetical protein
MIMVSPRSRPRGSIKSLLVLTLLAAVAVAFPAHAQTVQGRAVDRETMQPVSDASIALLDASGSAVATVLSGPDGTFRVTALAPGEYRVSASRLGYRPMLSGAVQLDDGQVVEVEARLGLEPVAMDTVDVLGRARPGISGVLVDNRTGQPVAAARVTLRDVRERTVARTETDSAGAFHLRIALPGGYTLLAERPGYQGSESGLLTLTPSDTVQVELRVATDAMVLAPLTVVSASAQVMRDHQLAGFQWRRERQPFGRYMDRDQIKQLNPFYATDVLQHFPQVQVTGRFDRTVTLPMRVRGANARCVPNLYVDGRMIRLGGGDFTIDGMVRGGGMAAVEVYVSPQTAPGEFPPFENPYCGVVVIWTEVVGSDRG